MTVKIIEGNILNTGATYIAHQCNCVTTYARGIADVIFKQYTYADSYSKRGINLEGRVEPESIPGTIEICGDGIVQRGIINMYAQYHPGKPRDDIDSVKDRRKWFHECLMHVAALDRLPSIAFPNRIGCNLGGGDWNWYFSKLVKFSDYAEKRHGTKVLIYKYEL